MSIPIDDGDHIPYTIATAHLTEVLALTLIEKGMLDKDDLCAELELLAVSHNRSGDPENPLTRELYQLANSLRAGSNGRRKD